MSILTILAVSFLPAPAAMAVNLAGELGTEELTEALPGEVAELLPDLSPEKLPDKGILQKIVERLAEKAMELSKPVFQTAGVVILVCLMVSLTKSLELREKETEYIVFAGVAAIGAVSIGDLDSYLQSGVHALENMCDYGRVVLPVLTSAAAASGSAAGAAAKYEATALIMDVLLSISRSVTLPCAGGYGALALADAAVGNDVLRSVKKLVKRVCTTVITLTAMGFTAWLSLTDLVSGTADTLGAKMAKTAVSAALPVVGRILSDAAATVTAAAGILRNSIGVFGILAVLGICLAGALPLGIRYLFYKLASAVCSCIADKRMGELVGDLGTCFGLILAVNGTGAFLLFFSFYSLMRTVLG